MAGHVSEAVLRRLPRYYRYLKELESDNVMQISSQELSERMGLTASQIRQDINCSGGEGRQGFGYSVPKLRKHIGTVLGIQHTQNMIIIGAGNIGRAIAMSDSFNANNFNTIGIFDVDPDKIGKKIGTLTVLDYENIAQFLQQHPVHIAVLAVPVSSAQAVVDTLNAYGVSAYWNFVPIDLNIPQNATIVSVHLEEGLQILSYKIKEGTAAL
ncbi:MAG TPA: redox-sensing transcriptional repressor Rex [Candidatus Limiplasma sp.]|nr:redox-sensing transcriptional repressor Rex [Candidatus Limiplasma sp.]